MKTKERLLMTNTLNLFVFLTFLSATEASGYLADIIEDSNAVAESREFREDEVKDYSLRKLKSLSIQNRRGKIRVHGWPLDKIRIKTLRTVMARNQQEAALKFEILQYKYWEKNGRVDLTTQFGPRLSLDDRLTEQKEKGASMDLEIHAPSRLALDISGRASPIEVESWNGDIQVRSISGPINVAKVETGQVSLSCAQCEIKVKHLKGNLRCIGQVGSIHLEAVTGERLFVETKSGDLILHEVSSQGQILTSQTGNILARLMKGIVQFQIDSGNIRIENGSGSISGTSEGGEIWIKMDEWKFEDDSSLIGSDSGNITLTIPGFFDGAVKLMSKEGKVSSEFEDNEKSSQNNRRLFLNSRKGNITLLRGK